MQLTAPSPLFPGLPGSFYIIHPSGACPAAIKGWGHTSPVLLYSLPGFCVGFVDSTTIQESKGKEIQLALLAGDGDVCDGP